MKKLDLFVGSNPLLHHMIFRNGMNPTTFIPGEEGRIDRRDGRGRGQQDVAVNVAPTDRPTDRRTDSVPGMRIGCSGKEFLSHR